MTSQVVQVVGAARALRRNAQERGVALRPLLLRAAAWQFFQRVVREPVRLTLEGGGVLLCYPHSTAASAALYMGLPERNDMRFVLDYLRAGDTFVDVGANVGVYSILAGAVPGVRVLALEPDEMSYVRLRENVALNPAMNITTLKVAAFSSDGTARFAGGRDVLSRLATVAGAEDETYEVVSAMLDTLIGTCRTVSVVKIDVEGHEGAVLRGAERLLKAGVAIVMEFNGVADVEFLRSKGYRSYEYDPEKRRLEPSASPRHGRNLIFLLDVEPAQVRVEASRSQ